MSSTRAFGFKRKEYSRKCLGAYVILLVLDMLFIQIGCISMRVTFVGLPIAGERVSHVLT